MRTASRATSDQASHHIIDCSRQLAHFIAIPSFIMASEDRQSLAAVAGSESMAAPGSGNGSGNGTGRASSSVANSSSAGLGIAGGTAPKKKRHRAGKKRRNRRQSFVAPSESTVTNDQDDTDRRPSLLDNARSSGAQNSFYRLKSAAKSNTSLESEALLDHR